MYSCTMEKSSTEDLSNNVHSSELHYLSFQLTANYEPCMQNMLSYLEHRSSCYY